MNSRIFGFTAVIPAAFTLVLAAAASASGTPGGSPGGFYFGTDTGVALAGNLESTRTNTGIPTNCDQWLDEFTFDDGTSVPSPLEECNPRTLPGSPNSFDLGPGFMAGVHLGYGWRNLRIEAEYFHREQGGDHLPLVVPGDEKQQEFVVRNEEISDFRISRFFANLHFDFPGLPVPGAIPHLGFGLGLLHANMGYSATSIRTKDRDELIALGRNPDAAGTASLASEALSDNLPGFQLLAGLDYAISSRLRAGLSLRYGGGLGDFEDGDNRWKPLRGHESTVGPPGSPGGTLPVHYGITAADLNFWGIALGLNHYF